MRFIIDFTDSATEENINLYLSINGCSVVRSHAHFHRTYLVEAATPPPVTEIVKHVIVDDDSTKVKLLGVSTKAISTTDDDNWWKLAVLAQADLHKDTVDIMRAGKGVKVYVLDSGIAADHPDFAGKDITLLHSLTGEFSDTTGHGTALASVIVGETCGITEASLQVVKIFHDGRATMLSDIIAAFDAVMVDYTSNNDALALMNMSWSVARNPYLEQKIQDMIDVGIFAVAAAGNDGRPLDQVTPAGMHDVITVGAFGQNFRPCNFSNYTGTPATSFTAGATNYGPALDYFAPGIDIRVAKPDGTFGHAVGTSIAAAITSAVLALRIRGIGYTWDKGGDENEIDEMVRQIGTWDLLDLTGSYSNSPNLIPVVNITSLENHPAPLVLYFEEDAKFSAWVYNPEKSTATIEGPDWLVFRDNYLVGTAPKVTERYEVFPYKLHLTNLASGEIDTQDGIAIVRRSDVSHDEAKAESKPIAIKFASTTGCTDFCAYYCCTCCGGKTGSCAQCYRPGYGCNYLVVCP